MQLPRLGCRALAFSRGQSIQRSDEELAVSKQTQPPGPGRFTAAAAFDERCREIARHNEQAQQRARKLRTARERQQILARRQRDAL